MSFMSYNWEGEPVTEEEFLKLSGSKMVNAERVEVEFNPYTGEKTKTITEVKIPLCCIETQRYVGGPSMEYFRLKEEENG